MISRNYNLEYKDRRKLLHGLDDYKGEGVMIMYSNSHAAFVKWNLRKIIEQAITLLVEMCSFGTLEFNPWLVNYLTSTWRYCDHKLQSYKGSSTNPKLIVTTVNIGLLPLCKGVGAPFLHHSSAGLFSRCCPSINLV